MLLLLPVKWVFLRLLVVVMQLSLSTMAPTVVLTAVPIFGFDSKVNITLVRGDKNLIQ